MKVTERKTKDISSSILTQWEGQNYIYSKDIITLRKREEELMRNKVEGIDNEQAKRQTLNHLFDKYISTRPDLADRTRASIYLSV